MSQREDKRDRRRRGSALVLSLLAVISVAGLTVALLTFGLSATRENGLRNDDERSLYLAEVGLMEAVTGLKLGNTGDVGTAKIPAAYGDGILWVEATPLDPNLTRLTCAGVCGGGRTALEVVVERVPPGRFPAALAGNGTIILKHDALVDSYDSDLGTYQSQLSPPSVHVDDDAVVASNGGITVSGGAAVFGDATPGPTGSVTMIGGTVSGSTAPAPAPFVLEPVTDVPVIPLGGALDVPAHTSLLLPPGDYHYTSVFLGVNSKLVVAGPSRIVVDGNLQAGSNVALVLGGVGQPVEVYLDGNVTFGANSTIGTPGGDASLVSLFLTGDRGQSATLTAKGSFHGTVYGPRSTVALTSDFEVFGAIAADEVHVNAFCKLHYDEALGRRGIVGGGRFELFARRSWRHTDFPASVFKNNTRDPFQLLKVPRGALPAPSEAHPPL